MQIAGLSVHVVYKNIKRLNLSVRPPDAHVRIAVPFMTSEAVIREFVTERLPWIERQQERILAAHAVVDLQAVTGEVHYLWGLPYTMVVRHEGRSKVEIAGDEVHLFVPASHNLTQRFVVIERWYRQQLLEAIPPLLLDWVPAIGREPSEVKVRKMKRKWGSCRPTRGIITLNLELAKYHPACLEYVLVHELVHFLEGSHNGRFNGLMRQFLPDWEKRKALLAVPLGGH